MSEIDNTGKSIQADVTENDELLTQNVTRKNIIVKSNQVYACYVDGVLNITCACDEIIVNTIKFRAHILGGTAGHEKPKSQANIVVTGLKVWDHGQYVDGFVVPYVHVKSDLCLVLTFCSNGKRVVLRRKTKFDCFCPSNIPPK